MIKQCTLGIALLSGTLITGCANVQPWEREHLSDRIMLLSESGLEEGFDQHMHRALSQGLIGKPGGVGGGCGCEQ